MKMLSLLFAFISNVYSPSTKVCGTDKVTILLKALFPCRIINCPVFTSVSLANVTIAGSKNPILMFGCLLLVNILSLKSTPPVTLNESTCGPAVLLCELITKVLTLPKFLAGSCV